MLLRFTSNLYGLGERSEITANPARNLGAPPKVRAGEGRMNPAGVPAFYGAFERETCVAELRPPVGIRQVKYDTDDQSLPEDNPKLPEGKQERLVDADF